MGHIMAGELWVACDSTNGTAQVHFPGFPYNYCTKSIRRRYTVLSMYLCTVGHCSTC